MTAYRLTGPAEEQIVTILARSANEYGRGHATNYEALILAAMADVAADHRRLGAARVARSRDVWVYELWHSRNRLPAERRIRDPWHKILYRVLPDDVVEVLAVVGRSYPSSQRDRRSHIVARRSQLLHTIQRTPPFRGQPPRSDALHPEASD